MRSTTLARLALAGTRTDTLRVALTASSAALGTLIVLGALTVLAIPTPIDELSGNQSEQYTNALLREPGLRPGVAFTLLMLTIPVLALAGQSARIGAPARDRRLAGLRLAGATPGQAIRIAATETGFATLLGTVLGLGAYLLARRLLHRPDADGRLALPTDALPAAGAMTAVVVGLPLLAAFATVVLLRRVAVTPFGVIRRQFRDRAPRPWPGVLVMLGVGALTTLEPLLRWCARAGRDIPDWLVPMLIFSGGLLATAGVIFGTGWISYTIGRVMGRFARRPSTLLAARRLTADPWSGSRTLAGLLACALFGAGAASVRAWFVIRAEVHAETQRQLDQLTGAVAGWVAQEPDFYVRTVDLVQVAVVVALIIAAGGVLIALAEGVVSRRRTYAALIATGVPRSVLGRSIAWQALAPAVPAIVLAVVVGAALPRGLMGEVESPEQGYTVCTAVDEALCTDPATSARHLRVFEVPTFTRSVEAPVADLLLYGGGALAAVLVTVAIGLLLLRESTDLTELRTA